MMSVAIEMQAVFKGYGEKQVLEDVNLNVPEHSVFAFLGNNGHGKSTTIRIIMGLARADRGSVRVLGNDIRRDRRHGLHQIGCIVESPTSYQNLTASEFLSIAVHLKRLPPTEICRVLELVGLNQSNLRRLKIEHFSLGMKQRLALANALIGSPRLLVLDEPTNGLDPNGIQEVRSLLSNLPDMADCTVFFASHYLDEVEKSATHLAVLHNGAIKFQAPIHELQRSLCGVLVIEVSDALNGAKHLQSFGYAAVPNGHTHITVSNIDREKAGEVHSHLIQGGIVLYQSVSRKPTLEQWFLGIADGSEGRV